MELRVAALLLIPVLAYSLVPAQVCYGTQLVRFRSGDTILAEPCGEQGGQVCFQSESGTVWMPRESVVSVEEVIPEGPGPAAVPPAAPEQAMIGEGAGLEDNQAESEEERKARLYASYKMRKVELLKKKGELHKRMKEDAYAGRGSSAVNAQFEIRAVNESLSQLEERAKSLFGGSLPDDWLSPDRANVDPKRLKQLEKAEQKKKAEKEHPQGIAGEEESPSSDMSPKEYRTHLGDLRETIRISIIRLEKKNNESAAAQIETMRKDLEALDANVEKQK